jgi:hypothetical protein
MLQNIQTLQLFTLNIKSRNYFQNLLKMPRPEAWVERPEGLLKDGVERNCLK